MMSIDAHLQKEPEFDHLARELFAHVQEKITIDQHGIPSFFDQWLLSLRNDFESFGTIKKWGSVAKMFSNNGHGRLYEQFSLFVNTLTRIREGRFVDFKERNRRYGIQSSKPLSHESQGALRSMEWRGRAIFKTAYDVALYPVIVYDLKPRTIVEIGSGNGSSAIWLADLAEISGIESRIISIDKRVPDIDDPRVNFLKGHCSRIEQVAQPILSMSNGHPWLLLEDAHAHVAGVLNFFHGLLAPGDYLIVEDSDDKVDVLLNFVDRHPSRYAVDTMYTDFFGTNRTCARNSIFKRIK